MKKIKLLAASALLICSGKIYANGVYPGPAYIATPPNYITYCQNEIFVKTFLPTAMVQFELTEEVLTNVLYVPLKTTIETLLLQTSQTVVNSLNKLNTELANIKMEESEERINTQKRINEDRIKEKQIYDKKLSQQQNQLFLGNSQDLEKEYFRQICNENKVREQTQSPKSKEKTIMRITSQVENTLKIQQTATSLESSMRDQVKRSRERYCSEEEFSNGLCPQVSEIPNGDLNAAIFFNPLGNSDPSDITENTNFTYNEIESVVANDFISNVVGIYPISSPTIEEVQNPRKQQFVAMYNMYLSAITLVKQVLQESYEKRMPIDDFDNSLSYLDYLDQQVKNITSNKNMLLFSNASKSGKQAKMYSAMAVNNKLNLELYELSERSKLLDAAILSLKENNHENLNYMKNRK